MRRFPICKQSIDVGYDGRAVGGRGGGTALRVSNRTGEILGIAVWFSGIRLFLAGEERTFRWGLVLFCGPPGTFLVWRRDGARMTRSASAFWLSALVISASAGAASAADQAIIRKAA